MTKETIQDLYNNISLRETIQGIELTTVYNGYLERMHYIGYDVEEFDNYQQFEEYLMDHFIESIIRKQK